MSSQDMMSQLVMSLLNKQQSKPSRLKSVEVPKVEKVSLAIDGESQLAALLYLKLIFQQVSNEKMSDQSNQILAMLKAFGFDQQLPQVMSMFQQIQSLAAK